MGNLKRGNCYVTSEAIYHLVGGPLSGWKPMVMRTATDTHWFLRHNSGLILDATCKQFKRGEAPDYSKARGTGFLTKKPSKRARELMRRMLWNVNVRRVQK